MRAPLWRLGVVRLTLLEMAELLPARTILVIDDELPVRLALTRVLGESGYSVLGTDSGREALELFKKHPIDLVISDHHMPEMSGIDLLKLVRVRHPHVVRIILTGDKDPELTLRSINEGEVYRFIRKPWDNTDLRTMMHFAFETVRLEREKRKLLEQVRDERLAVLSRGSPEDPAGLEREVMLLAEEELRGR
jgi:two-component system, probable response regulator PhcQ